MKKKYNLADCIDHDMDINIHRSICIYFRNESTKKLIFDKFKHYVALVSI